mgnify:CR=1 FL=1
MSHRKERGIGPDEGKTRWRERRSGKVKKGSSFLILGAELR